jgi:hypothetical protein
MSRTDFPYCIPDRRGLTLEEQQLLKHLAADSSEIENHLDRLKVVARCGCGECPTILFGESLDDEPIWDSESAGDWTGRAANGTMVGIGLFVSGGKPTELEAWSLDGGEIDTWPATSAIQRCAD